MALAFTCAAHQSSDMLYSPVLAQADNKETTAVIVRTFMREMMASATESECRTQPAFCGRLLRTVPTSHADTPYLSQIAHWPIQIVFMSGIFMFRSSRSITPAAVDAHANSARPAIGTLGSRQ